MTVLTAPEVKTKKEEVVVRCAHTRSPTTTLTGDEKGAS